MSKVFSYTMIVGGVALLALAGFDMVGYDVRLIAIVVAMAVVAMAIVIDMITTWGIRK